MRCFKFSNWQFHLLLGWQAALLAIGLVVHAPAHAEEDWLSRSQRLLEQVQQHERPAWLTSNPYQLDAKAQAQQIFGTTQTGDKTIPTNTSGKPLRVVFISFSLGTATLKGLFAEASGQEDVLLVLRGPKPGQKLSQLYTELRPLLKGLEPLPNIVIDPTRFQKWQVSTVPEMLIEDPGKLPCRVKGVTSLEWLKSQQAKGCQGDLGKQGEVYAIAEIDLLAELKQRIAAIDWPKKQQQAMARFWQTRQFEVLPIAQQHRDRLVDLTVTAPRDVFTPTGKLIIPAGHTVNPLDQITFGLCLVVFDGTDKAQLAWARQTRCDNPKARVLYLVTQLPRTEGWEGLKTLETALHAPVYLLTADVKQRFQLQAVPAIVEQIDHQLRVREQPTFDRVTDKGSQP